MLRQHRRPNFKPLPKPHRFPNSTTLRQPNRLAFRVADVVAVFVSFNIAVKKPNAIPKRQPNHLAFRVSDFVAVFVSINVAVNKPNTGPDGVSDRTLLHREWNARSVCRRHVEQRHGVGRRRVHFAV